MKQTLLTICLILFALPCWGQTQRCHAVYKSQFGKAMIKHGYVQERDRNGRYWKGVSIPRLAA